MRYMMSGEGKDEVVDMDEAVKDEAESKEEVFEESDDSDDDDDVDEVEDTESDE